MERQGQPAPAQPSAPRGGGLRVALRRALFGVGPVATGRALIRRIKRDDPELFRAAPPAAGRPHPFDEEFGVETGGFVGWRDLQAGGANDPYISGYLAISPSVGRRIFGLVEDPGEFTFIDFGCGKGRAVFLASELPFRRVIGVEIGGELAAAARRNAAVITGRFPRHPPVEVVHGDAAAFDLPLEPLVVFLNQPFEVPVMRQVLSRLEASLAAAPRPVIVIYLFPVLARVLDRSAVLERAAEGWVPLQEHEVPYAFGGRNGGEQFVIWRTRSPKPGVARL